MYAYLYVYENLWYVLVYGSISRFMRQVVIVGAHMKTGAVKESAD